MVEIVGKDAKILRQKAKPVLVKDIETPKLKKIIRDMKAALDGEDDGVAIAAPQIGAPYRVFIVSPKIFDIIARDKNSSVEDTSPKKDHKHMIFINPEIIKLSKEKEPMEEGCLSVRYFYGDVERSIKAKVRAYDEKGKKFELGGSGLLAQIFQHEIDHLDGVLFIDKAENLRDMPPEEKS